MHMQLYYIVYGSNKALIWMSGTTVVAMVVARSHNVNMLSGTSGSLFCEKVLSKSHEKCESEELKKPSEVGTEYGATSFLSREIPM